MAENHANNNHPAQWKPGEIGFDWQKSPVHLEFLSMFVRPQITAEGFSKLDSWEGKLGEDPQEAVKRFLDEGLLVHMGLNEYLAYQFILIELRSMLEQRGLPVSGWNKTDLASQLVQADPDGVRKAIVEDFVAYQFKVTELKNMLKQRGLPVSGPKSDLVTRLLQADPEALEKAIVGLTVLQCSERGREVANQYLRRKARMPLSELALGVFRREMLVGEDLGTRWGRAGDREKIVFLVIIGAFFCSLPVCIMLYQGYSLADAFNQPNVRDALLSFGLPGFLMLFLAIAIWWRKRRRSRK